MLPVLSVCAVMSAGYQPRKGATKAAHHPRALYCWGPVGLGAPGEYHATTACGPRSKSAGPVRAKYFLGSQLGEGLSDFSL